MMFTNLKRKNSGRVLPVTALLPMLLLVIVLVLTACGGGGGGKGSGSESTATAGSSGTPEQTPDTTATQNTSGGSNKDITGNFTDPLFLAYVQESVGNSEGEPIFASDVSSIKTIAVSNMDITSLDGMEFFTSLTTLYCSNNRLTQLDIGENTALEILNCGINQLTALDVSKNIALKDIACYTNLLNELDVSKNTALEKLDCSYNQLTRLDVSNNVVLEKLSCTDSPLTRQDITGLDESRTTVILD